MTEKDVTNRFLALEIWLPWILALIAAGVAWGQVSADLEHKAEKEDVAVISTKVENIEDDVAEIKDEVKENTKILERIATKLGAEE